jgi:hypothetical protein
MAIKESFLRTRRKFILAKLETTYGVDAAPVGSDAMLTENLVIKPEVAFVERKTDRRAMGSDLSIHTSKFLTFEFDVDFQASGQLGIVPGWDRLMKACGHSRTTATTVTGTVAAAAAINTSTVTLAVGSSAVDGFYKNRLITLTNVNGFKSSHYITAYVGTTKVATVVPALKAALTTASTYALSDTRGTALAGGANTITLALPANGSSIVDDFYLTRIVKIYGGTGAGQSRQIGGYVGATQIATLTDYWDVVPDATSLYTISGGGVAYQPTSTTFDALTLYGYMDGQLRAAVGCRGTWSLKLDPAALPKLHFTFTGIWVDPIAATDPTAAPANFKMPEAFGDLNTQTFTLANIDQRVYEFDMDVANDVKYRDVVNARTVSIIDRSPTGNITLEAPPLSEKNWWLDTVQNQTRPMQMVHGTDVGFTVELFAPKVQCFSPTDGDKDGVLTLGLKMAYLPVNGDDEYTLICR